MAADSKKPDPKTASPKGGTKPAGGSQRKPVTIDLEAREVNAGKSGEAPVSAAAASSKPATPGSGPASGTGSAGGTEPAKAGEQKPDPAPTGAPAAKADGPKPAATSGAPASEAKPAEAKASGATTAQTSSAAPRPGETAKPGAGGAPAGGASTAAANASAASPRPATSTSGASAASDPARPSSGMAADAKADAGSSASASSAAASEKPASPPPRPASSPASAKPGPAAGRDGAPRSSTGISGLIAASLVGGVVALAGAWGAGKAGLLPAPAPSAELRSVIAEAQNRVSGLETRIAELSQGQETASGATNDMAAVRTRISELEATLEGLAGGASSSISQEASSRIAEIENGLSELRRFVSSGGAGESAGLASLQDAQAKLVQSVEGLAKTQGEQAATLEGLSGDAAGLEAAKGEIASLNEGTSALRQAFDSMKGQVAGLGGDLDTLGKGQAALEARLDTGLKDVSTRLAALEERIAPIEAQMGDASARETAARAVAVSALKSAMDRGAPFATELAAVASALPQGTDLSDLAARAEAGVPTRTALHEGFAAVARRMSAVMDAPAEGDLVDSLLSNARSLVSIRQPGESDAATPQAALGRMEARVGRGDFAGALQAYDELPENVRAAGADWVADARARLAADALVDRVTGDVLKSMGQAGAPAASN
jgi:hypothetical protein